MVILKVNGIFLVILGKAQTRETLRELSASVSRLKRDSNIAIGNEYPPSCTDESWQLRCGSQACLQLELAPVCRGEHQAAKATPSILKWSKAVNDGGFPSPLPFFEHVDSRLQVLKPGCAVPKYSCFFPAELVDFAIGWAYVCADPQQTMATLHSLVRKA